MDLEKTNFRNFRYSLSKITDGFNNILFQFKFSDFLVYENFKGVIFFVIKKENASIETLNRAGNKIRIKLSEDQIHALSSIPVNSFLVCKKDVEHYNIVIIDCLAYDGLSLLSSSYVDRKRMVLNNDSLKIFNQDEIKDKSEIDSQKSYCFRKRDSKAYFSLSGGQEVLSEDIKLVSSNDLEDAILADYYVNRLKGGEEDVIFIAYQYRRKRKVKIGKVRIKDPKLQSIAVNLINSNKRAVCELQKNNKRNVNYDFVCFKSGKPFDSVIEKRKRIKVFYKSVKS